MSESLFLHIFVVGTSPHQGLLQRLIERLLVLRLEISTKDIAMIDSMFERWHAAFQHEIQM